MRVDALLAVAAAVLASTLLVHFYLRSARAYALAFDCYARALEVANHAARNLTTGLSGVKPPKGFTVILRYPDGGVVVEGSGLSRCYAYALASVNNTLLLVEARG